MWATTTTVYFSKRNKVIPIQCETLIWFVVQQARRAQKFISCLDVTSIGIWWQERLERENGAKCNQYKFGMVLSGPVEDEADSSLQTR